MARTKVFCWQSGLIEFGTRVPEGAIAIAEGEKLQLRRVVYAIARHSYDGTEMLVPGIPEAPNSDEKLSALALFSRRISDSLDKSFAKMAMR